MEFVIVSGMSGAGKSKAVSFFEDMGFYCVDNMPCELIPKFAEMCMAASGRFKQVVLVVDVRGGADFHALFSALESLKQLGCDYKILYLEAATEVIINRYKETRHRHPLYVEGLSTEKVIEREHEMLSGVRVRADYIVDTTKLSTSKLRDRLIELFSGKCGAENTFIINVISFGFKYGIPPESDLVFDVRFLPNPYYVTELRALTGMDKDVHDYVMGWQQTTDFMKKLCDMMDFLVPQYIEEGKTSLVISIGCTGGKHRSVTLANELCEHIKTNKYRCVAQHRDYERDSNG